MGIFSEELVDDRHELAVAILTADLHGKEVYDYPDYAAIRSLSSRPFQAA
jgi:hypothetical protein